MARCVLAVDLETQGLLDTERLEQPRQGRLQWQGLGRLAITFFYVAILCAVAGCGVLVGIEMARTTQVQSGPPNGSGQLGVLSLAAEEDDENNKNEEKRRGTPSKQQPGEEEKGEKHRATEKEATKDKGKEEGPVTQGSSDEGNEHEDGSTSWMDRLNPSPLVAAARGVMGCIQHKGVENNANTLSEVFFVQPCLREIIAEHTQHGLVVPLEDFDWPVPSTWSKIFSSLVVMAVLAACAVAARWILKAIKRGNFQTEFALSPNIDKVAAELEWDPKEALKIGKKPPTLECLRSEVIIQSLQQFAVVLIGVLAGLIWGSPPLFVAGALYALPALRVARLERSAVEKLGQPWTIGGAYEFVSSKMEIVDASSDGLALAAVILLEAQDSKGAFAARMAAAWGSGLAAWVLPLMGQAHSLSCAMLAVMAASSLATIAVTAGHKWQKPMLDFAGLGLALSLYPQRVEDGHLPTASFKGLYRIGFEAIPQLYLPGTAVMMSDTSLVEQPFLAISICMTYCTGLAKLGAMVVAFVKNAIWSERLLFGRRWTEVVWWLSCCLPVLLPFFLVNLSFFRVFVAETCESHIWGLTTGCVVAPALE